MRERNLQRKHSSKSQLKKSQGIDPWLFYLHRLNMISSIAVLFADKNSIYKTMVKDVYTIENNALTFKSDKPVICHPPCRLFSRLRKFSTAPALEKELAYFAVSKVQENGGILEHPVSSTLFKEMQLPLPGHPPDQYGGFTICVNQNWFDFPARKPTLLYIVGCSKSELPPIPISFNAIAYTISQSNLKGKHKNGKKELPKSLRSSTTVRLARWLIEVALNCQKSNHFD